MPFSAPPGGKGDSEEAVVELQDARGEPQGVAALGDAARGAQHAEQRAAGGDGLGGLELAHRDGEEVCAHLAGTRPRRAGYAWRVTGG